MTTFEPTVLDSPSTPPRPTKRQSTAPPLQRAGHAFLTLQSHTRFSTLSTGLLPLPDSPLDDSTQPATIDHVRHHKSLGLLTETNTPSFADILATRALDLWHRTRLRREAVEERAWISEEDTVLDRPVAPSIVVPTREAKDQHTSHGPSRSTRVLEKYITPRQLSRRSVLSDTSRTLLALFPLPPRPAQLSPDASTQSTIEGPLTPPELFQRQERGIEIELQELGRTQTFGLEASPVKVKPRIYSLPKPPLRQNKSLPMLPPESTTTTTRTTPPRAIFADLTTAYQAIRSKSNRDLTDVQASQDLPLPPVPARKRQSPPKQRTHGLNSTVATKTAEEETTSPTFLARLSRALGQESKHDAVAKTTSLKPSKTVTYSTQTLARRRRARHVPIDAFARFSMPEVSVLRSRSKYRDDSDNAALLDSPSSRRTSSVSSLQSHRRTEHGSRSTDSGSRESATHIIENYMSEHSRVRPASFRRYSALPRLQHSRNDHSADETTSTIGDILSQYGEPEYRSLPASASQKLQVVPTALVDGVASSRASLSTLSSPLRGKTMGRDDLRSPSGQDLFQMPVDDFTEPSGLRKPPPAVLASRNSQPRALEDARAIVDTDSTPLIDYGDTRDLLHLSSSSLHMDQGRGNKQSRMSAMRRSSSDPSLLDVQSTVRSHSSNDQPVNSYSEKPFVAAELPRLSDHPYYWTPDLGDVAVLGLSHHTTVDSPTRFEGDNSPAQPGDKKENKNPFRRTQPFPSEQVHDLPAAASNLPDQLSMYFSEQASATRIQSVQAGQKHSITAFTPCDVMPAAFRHSPSKTSIRSRTSEDKQTWPASREVSSPLTSDSDSTDEEDDWETMSESRRTDMGHGSMRQSVLSINQNRTNQRMARIGLHPADDRYNHTYRLHSPPGSTESVLVPTYDRGGVNGFPYTNGSYSSEQSMFTLDRFPVPPANHRHGFQQTSSPNQMPSSEFSQTSLESVIYEYDEKHEENHPVPYGLWRGTNLSVVYEQSGERSSASEVNVQLLTAPSVIATAPSAMDDESNEDIDTSSVWISCGPGPEITSVDNESAWQHVHDSPTQRSKSRILASGADTSLLRNLRHDDGQMTGSSPLSVTNSFAKKSKLGPHANITGSVNGTNMRFVGSSVVGSSSPVASPESTHSVQITPRRLERPQVFQETTSSLIEESSSFAWHRPRSYMIPKDKWSMLIPGRPSSKHAAQVPVSHIRAENHSRSAVASQKALMELSLARTQSPNVMTSISRPTRGPYERSSPIEPREHRVRPSARSAIEDRTPQSNRTPDTLLPIADSRLVIDHTSPHLHRTYRPPSSQVADLNPKKQRLSWICLVLFAFFPPMLIFFGHGLCDPVMSFMSGRKIEHFGRRQKEIGKYVGYFATGAVLMGLGIALIIIRTVPNNLPRSRL